MTEDLGTPTRPHALTGEQWRFEVRPDDPPSPADDERWIRSDLDSGDRVATLKCGDGTEIPLFATGTSEDTVREARRFYVGGQTVYAPLAPVDEAAYPARRVQHAGEVHAYHDRVAPGSAIPDSGDLHSRYDFSKEDGTLPITDQTGNGFDLENGSYTGVSVNINGVQAGDFDGGDDRLYTSFTGVGSTFHVFLVFEYRSLDGSAWNAPFDGDGSFDHIIGTDSSQNDKYSLFAGTRLPGDTTPSAGDIVVVSALFDGANSEIRVNESTEASGDAGSATLDGITLGASGGGGNEADAKIGEVLVYPQDKSGSVASIESYLIDKWGPTGFA